MRRKSELVPVLPPRRAATLRWLLALADLIAAAGGLALIGVLTGRGVDRAGLVALPSIVLIAKLMGRYDHDDPMLRKSTLDELSSLLAVAGAWSLVAFVAGEDPKLGAGGVAVMWLGCSALLVFARSQARTPAGRATGRERVLIVGGATSANVLHTRSVPILLRGSRRGGSKFRAWPSPPGSAIGSCWALSGRIVGRAIAQAYLPRWLGKTVQSRGEPRLWIGNSVRDGGGNGH